MAEVYPPGVNRIFYQASGFRTGLEVKVDVLKPDFTNHEKFLTEIGGGLYYFDFNFYQEGTWIGVFYEDGEKKKTQPWSIRKEPSGGIGRFIGNNVINT